MKAKMKLRKAPKIIGFKDFRENSEKYIKLIKKGQTFTVVRKSEPVFKMISAVDEWGDEGVWETIIDFREIDPKGVPAEDVIKAIDKIYG
jgi:pyruvate/2-oxoglutarate/acetoin dehydrogenase E1 component